MLRRKEFVYALRAMTGYACAACLYVLVKYWGMDATIMISKSSGQVYYLSKILTAFIGTALVIAVPFRTEG